MATRSGLPASTVTDTSVFAFTKSGTDYKIAASDLQTFMQDGVVATTTKWERTTFLPGSSLIQGAASSDLYVPTDLTLTAVHIACDTAPVEDSIIVDVHLNGTTVFTTQSNRPEIATSSTSDLASSPEVTDWTAGDTYQVIIDQLDVDDDVNDIGNLIVTLVWTEG